jgi:hypothetical protein
MKICINCGYEGEKREICPDCGSEMNPPEQFNPERLCEIREARKERLAREKELRTSDAGKTGKNLHFS